MQKSQSKVLKRSQTGKTSHSVTRNSMTKSGILPQYCIKRKQDDSDSSDDDKPNQEGKIIDTTIQQNAAYQKLQQELQMLNRMMHFTSQLQVELCFEDSDEHQQLNTFLNNQYLEQQEFTLIPIRVGNNFARGVTEFLNFIIHSLQLRQENVRQRIRQFEINFHG